MSHFQEINESPTEISEVTSVISATDLEMTVEEDFEETNNVCIVNRILYFWRIFYVKYFRLNVMIDNNKLLV